MGQVSRQKNLTGNTTIRRRLFFLLYILLIPILSVQLLIYRDRIKDLSNSALRSNMEVARAAATSAYSFVQNIALYQRGISFLLISRNSLKVDPISGGISNLILTVDGNVRLQSIVGRVQPKLPEK